MRLTDVTKHGSIMAKAQLEKGSEIKLPNLILTSQIFDRNFGGQSRINNLFQATIKIR